MNMMKRILALLLSLSLVIGMMPGVSLTAFAEETETEEAASAETVPETTAEETEPAETVPEETVSETTVPAETVPEETESEETAEEPAPVEVVVFNPVTKEVMGTQLASDVNYIDPDMGYSWENPYYPVWDWNEDGTEISAFMQSEADYISFAVTVSGAMYFGDQFITNVNGTEEEPFVMTCWGPEDGSLWGLMVTVKIGQFEEEPEEEPPVAAWEYIEDEEWDTVDWETSWEEPFNPTWTYNEDGTGMVACITVTEDFDCLYYYVPEAGALYEGGWPDGDGYTEAWFFDNVEAGYSSRMSWQGDYGMSFRLTVMFADGESGSDQPSEPDGSVANEQYLQDQIDSGSGWIYVNEEVVLENDFVIPDNVGVYVNAKLTVPDDVTLTINSGMFHIHDGGILYVEEDGHVVIGNTISCWNGASMVIDGTYEFSTDWGYIIVNYEDGVSADQFSGIADEDTSLRFIPATEAELQEAAEIMNSAGFGSYIVLVHDSLTLTEDFTIPGNCTFTISDAQSTVTVSEGVTVTNYGNLYVNPDETLHNYGTIVNNGQFSNDGTVINDGEVQNNRYLNNWGTWQGNDPVVPPMTQDDLEAALDALDPYNNYWLNNTVILERNLTIDEDQYLGIGPSGKLIVPEDITLTAGTNINVNAGGTLEIQGEFVKAHGEPWLVSVGYENGTLGNVIGIDRKDIALNYYVNINNPDALQAAEALLEEWGFGWNFIYQWVDVTLDEDFTIPESTFLHLYGGSTLTVPEDVTLTNKGELYVWENAQLVNNGTIENDMFMLVVGTLTNNSTINVNDVLVVDGPGTVQNNGDVYINGGCDLFGTWLGNEPIRTYMTQDELEEAIESHAEEGKNYGLTESVTLERDMTLKGTDLILSGTLIVPEEITLTLDTALIVIDGGEVINNGTINVNGYLWVEEPGAVQNNGNVYINGEYDIFGTWEGNEPIIQVLNEQYLQDQINAGKTELVVDRDITLENNFRLPSGVELTIEEGCTLTIPQGKWFNVNCLVNVYGTINNQNWMEVHGPIYFLEDGGYTGNGIIRVDATMFSDVWSALDGLDLDGFEIIGGPGYWDVHNVDGLPRLGTPTDLYWENGYAHWTMTQPHERNARICLYQEGVDEPIRVFGCGWMDGDSYSFNMMDGMDLSEDASFYFTVEALSSSVGYASSEAAVSETWTYVVPEVDMGVCTDIIFDGETVSWTGPEGADKTTWYEVVFLHIQMTDDEPVVTFLNIGACNSNSFNIQDEWGYFYDEFGSGNYVVDVRALSNNVLEVAHGPWYSSNEVSYDGASFEILMNHAVLKKQIEEHEAMGGMSVQLRERVILEGDLVVPESVPLNIYEGGELFVPAGCTLTINSSSYMMQGVLIVEEGGKLVINKDFWVNNSDILEVYGEVVFGHNAYLNSAYGSDCTIIGVPEEKQNLHFYCETAEAVMDAVDFMEDNAYGKYTVNAWPASGEWITLDRDLTIPENCEFCVGFVTIAEGVTVTNKGKIQIGDGPTLINNGTVLNYGTIDIYPEYGHWEGNPYRHMGTMGENITWEFVEETGMMYITGSGEMPFGSHWYEISEKITGAVISEGITNIGEFTFFNLPNLTSVEIPNTVTNIAYKAFSSCTSLQSVELPESLQSIQSDVFIDSAVSEVIFTGDAPILDEYIEGFGGTFSDITATAYYPADNETWTEEFLSKNYGGNITWMPDTPEARFGTLTAKSGTVSLEDVIYVNFYYQYADGDLTQEYLEENGGMLIWQKADYPGDEEAVFGHEAAEVSAGLKYVESNGRYMGRTSGLPLRFLNDTLVIVGYVELPDGSYLYAPSKEYSGRIYAENRIKNIDKQADPSQKLIYERDLSIALLNAIAEAQTYFNYNVDDLANSSLSDERKEIQWSSDLLTPAATVDPNKTLERDTAVFTGRSATLSLVGKTEINFYFAIPEDTKAEAVDSGILFWTEEDYKNAVTLDSASATYDVEMAYFEANNRWGAAYPVGFASSEYEETVYACAYLVDSDGEFHYSGLVSYSVEQYCYNQIKNSKPEAALSKNLVVYGEAAQTYFGK